MKLFKTISIFVLAAGIQRVSAQNSVQMPAMPTMPSIPKVAAPTVGGGFYTPSAGNFYSGGTPRGAGAASAQGGTESRILTESQKQSLQSEFSISRIDGAADMGGGQGASASLTASDIATLSDMGLLGPISGLLQSPRNKGQNDAQTLEKILGEIREIKATSNQESPASVSKIGKPSPKILRFTADGADYLNTIKTAFFSEEEADGTFLLTGDAKYSVGGRIRNETFYLLFRSKGTENGMLKYEMSSQVSQSIDDAKSVFRRLSEACSESPVEASRTGNLITLRLNESALSLDILLAMDN